MRTEENIELSEGTWNELLSTSSFASVFQTPEYYRLYNSVPGRSAKVYSVGGIDLKAICVVTIQKEKGLKGFFSRRAIVYGGPVLNGINEKEFESLIRSIQSKTAKAVIYTEIRNLHSYNDFDLIFKRNKWKYLPYQNFLINCSDKEILLKKMGNNRKRQIKKAFETGVELKVADSQAEVHQFYKMIKKLYENKVRKPLPPIEFFEEFFRANSGKYLLVKYRDIIIGGIMCPVFPGKCIYEQYVFGLDDEYKNLYPSVMATWAAIEYAFENKIPLFDFMGAGRKDQNYGVREFKSRFGGELVEYGRYIKINNIFLYKVGEIALNLLRRNKK